MEDKQERLFRPPSESSSEEHSRPFQLVTIEFFPPDEFLLVKEHINKTVIRSLAERLPSMTFIVEIKEFEKELKRTFQPDVFSQPCSYELYTLLLTHYLITRRIIVNETEQPALPQHTKKTLILDDGLATKLFMFSSFNVIDEYELYQNMEFMFLGIYPELSFFRDPESIVPNTKQSDDIDYKKIKKKIEAYAELYKREGNTECIIVSGNLSEQVLTTQISEKLITHLMKTNNEKQ